MDARVFDLRRDTAKTRGLALCKSHLGRRAALGWLVDAEHGATGRTCEDCAAGPSVLDRKIESSDAAAKAAEPEPVRVLPGQKGWEF